MAEIRGPTGRNCPQWNHRLKTTWRPSAIRGERTGPSANRSRGRQRRARECATAADAGVRVGTSREPSVTRGLGSRGVTSRPATARRTRLKGRSRGEGPVVRRVPGDHAPIGPGMCVVMLLVRPNRNRCAGVPSVPRNTPIVHPCGLKTAGGRTLVTASFRVAALEPYLTRPIPRRPPGQVAPGSSPTRRWNAL